MSIARTTVASAVAILACATVWLGLRQLGVRTLYRLLGDGLTGAQELWPVNTLASCLSPWMCLGILVVTLVTYFAYALFCRPMDRVRLLGELGYAPDGKVDMKEMSKLVQRRRQTGDVPPVYPNGWFGILESRRLKAGGVKSVSVLGEYLQLPLRIPIVIHHPILVHLRST